MAAAAASSSLVPGSRWCFSRQQLQDSPSRRGGVDWDKELSYRQQTANLLQDMGQRLSVSQLTINTAIVYMHRFYMQQCFTKFHRNIIAPATLFLAAKVEEQSRKLEHVIKVAHACLNPQEPPPDVKSEAYLQEAQDLVILESIILQTLGFEITIDHPHTHVVKCTQLVRASKDLAQTSYFMATNRLFLTPPLMVQCPTVSFYSSSALSSLSPTFLALPLNLLLLRGEAGRSCLPEVVTESLPVASTLSENVEAV